MINNCRKRNGLLRWGAKLLAGIILIATQWTGDPSGAQVRKRAETARVAPQLESDSIEQTIRMICEERVRDRQGTIPIDEMAVQSPLPVTDPRVIAGKERAQRLLPVAKGLVPSILSRLAAIYQSETINRDRVLSRLGTITTIRPDVEERDNASVRAREPHAIVFGTIFLVGLRSDEAMIAVLAHELTHVVDGPEHTLQSLFARVGARSSQLSGIQIRIQPAIELTCELVGIHVMQEYLVGALSNESKRQRLARAFEKNCVRVDLADAAHLSPRGTLRMLLMLEPDLTMAIAGNQQKGLPEKKGLHIDQGRVQKTFP